MKTPKTRITGNLEEDLPEPTKDDMKTENIYAVTEAFSIQPRTWFVGSIYQNFKAIDRIVVEAVYDTGDPYDFYVGYDKDDKRVFQIRVQCATVDFY